MVVIGCRLCCKNDIFATVIVNNRHYITQKITDKQMNYRQFVIGLSLLLSIGLFSCRNSQELVYMQDTANHEILEALPDSITEYQVKPGDILYVSIKSMNAEVNALFNPEAGMSTQSYNSFQKFTTPQGAYLYGFEVDKDGNLRLPILGLIPVAGNPQSEIEAIVQAQADKYLKDAIVKVKLLNYMVTVLGEVKNPGVYYNYNNNFTLLSALGMANGNTDFADIKKVTIIRPMESGKKVIKLDLSNKESWMSEAFYLYPNDYVFVEPDKHKNFQLNSQAYSLMFSSFSILLAVFGFLL
ncbi:polysaccharide biosynthesis/export family protein [uncultured Sunxiuqinia sp.]|uniref:polysaccharide biosynthesis/export family protein n=1 Tax=uncultured Sunxiuqinia sp. TaxID=1573825 RepID=UPI0026038EC2|nr:polysaccharide biosynthesis/export family protein [uncultured Sunxiuqinia sp.]